MARKSRKNNDPVTVVNVAAYIRTAMYIRLSTEDNKNRGNSIETQTKILENFIAINPDFKLYDTYIDNGATGTNFERPEFKRMITDVESGNIDCIIVKDLSRLGRNAIDTGYYIEKFFCLKKIRFISVTDDFDTADKESDNVILPLKNMINEAYSIDIGRKIRAQAQQDMKAGNFVGSRPPYGYLKDPDNCHKLIVNKETAPIVKQMFEWAADGIGVNPITKLLNEEGILTPNEYAKAKGLVSEKNGWGSGKWQSRTVSKILSEKVYVGDMVQGKHTSINHKQVPVSEENWIVVENTHEPIISRELFDSAKKRQEQTAAKYDKNAVIPYTENILRGKIFCQCCGRNVHRQRSHNSHYYYHCITNDRIAKGSCIGVKITEDELFQILLTILKEQAGVIIGKQLFIQQTDAKLRTMKDDLKSQMPILKSELDKNRRFLRGLYENLVNGVLTNAEYFEMKAEYETKITAIMESIATNGEKLNNFDIQSASHKNLADFLKQISSNSKLSKELIDRTIDSIYIDSEHNIVVHYRFENEFSDLFHTIDEVVCKASCEQEALWVNM